MILLKSYPKSGNTWLKFILCNLLYPDIEHDFSTIKKYCPTLEDPNEPNLLGPDLKLAKTHEIDITAPLYNYKSYDDLSVIWIHRHIGDVLISFWYHCQKFFDEKRTFSQFCKDLDYGRGWREFVNKSSFNWISYEDISNINCLKTATKLDNSDDEWLTAIEKSKFKNIKEIEDYKGIDCVSNESIKFCRNGESKQYKNIEPNLLDKIIESNKRELQLLGYD